MGKTLTVKDLLSRKDQIKNRQLKTLKLYVDSLDGEIIIQEPPREIAVETLAMAQDDTMKADQFAVYHCVITPDLKDPVLQKEYGCVEPTDIVEMLFRAGEIAAISGQALKLSGFAGSVRMVDDEIKN
ncbi:MULTISPECIES: hypothetical protein [unclassified Brevibacillus]|uniref:phage tail assembly chaperone n=1 Tax=unclassified Brevibacillus TaxID=2684853 RepID=UPI003563BB1B